MLNPYQAPNLEAVRYEFRQQKEAARQAVKGPAIGLIAVSCLSLFMGLVTIVWDTILIATDPQSFDDLPLGAGGFVVKTVWGLIILANSGFAIWAGFSLQKLRQHQLCWLAGILACIPAIGPCFCLGIPFGIWAIVVLNRSDVADAFDHG